MILQRLTADQGAMTGTLMLRTVPEDANSYAELLSLAEELKLRANVEDEGSIITSPRAEDVPPPAEG
jgi:hypothetical protein